MKRLVLLRVALLPVVLLLAVLGLALGGCAGWPCGMRDMGPANPNASEKAKQVLEYLHSLPDREEKRVLTGQHVGFRVVGIDWQYPRSIGSLYEQTGAYPALIGVDYGHATAEEIAHANEYLIEHWEAGGLVTISLHADNPWTGGKSGDLSGRDLVELITPETGANMVWMAELDKIAAGLDELRDAGVVVLWRPFHEMNFPEHYGFWWSYGAVTYDHPEQGVEAWVDMWRHMFDYFTYEKGLDNLLWVYAPANRDDWDSLLVTWPGEKYVDVVGVDVYGDNVSIRGEGYEKLLSTCKPVALTEFGPDPTRDGTYSNLTTIQAIKDRYPEVTYFLQWHSWGTPEDPVAVAIADNQDAGALMGDAWCITRDEVDWRVDTVADISTDLRSEIAELAQVEQDVAQSLAAVQGAGAQLSTLSAALTQAVADLAAIADRLEAAEAELKAAAGEL